MVKKINILSILLLFFLLVNNNSVADNHVAIELDPKSSGGPKIVKLPKSDAKKFLREKGLKEGLNER